MRTSVSIWHEREAIALVAKAGFDGIDLPICDFGNHLEFLTSGQMEQMVMNTAAAAKECGLEVSQVHLPYWYTFVPLPGDESFEAFSQAFVPLVIGAIELAAKAGCKVAALHLIERFDKEETKRFNKQYIDALRPVVQKTGVCVAMENTFYHVGTEYLQGNFETIEDMCEYADYGGDGFGLCLDTGHALIARQDPVKMVEAYGKRLKALHVNDNLGPIPGAKDSDLHMIPGDPRGIGLINWIAFSQALKSVGYEGAFNMELVRPYDVQKSAYYPTPMYAGYYQYAAAIGRHYAAFAE